MDADDEKIRAALHAFLLAAFGGEPAAPDSTPDFTGARTAIAAHRTLRADTLALWPPATRLAARELLMAWFMCWNLTAFRASRCRGRRASWRARRPPGSASQS